MCRTGGRRCPSCSSRTGRDKHNERRRRARSTRSAAVAYAAELGAHQLALKVLAGAPPDVARSWADQVGMDRPDLRETDSPPRPLVPLLQDSWGWVSPEILDQVSAAARNLGRDPIERKLIDGKIDWAEDHSHGVNEVQRVEYADGEVGYFKPFSGVQTSTARGYGQSQALQPLHETAAWQLAREMGDPWSRMVPRCVLRPVEDRIGSVIAEARGEPPYSGVHDADYDDVMAGAFYDSLIGQQDRHSGNYFVHYDDETVQLLDHGFSFALPGDRVNMSEFVKRRWDIGASALNGSEHRILSRLVVSPDLLGIADVIGASRAAAMRDRIARMRSTNQLLPYGSF